MRLTRKESSFHQGTSSSPELGRKGSKYKIDIREIDKHNEDQTTKKTETHEISNLITRTEIEIGKQIGELNKETKLKTPLHKTTMRSRGLGN